MANILLSMTKIKKVLRLLADGVKKRKISRLAAVSRESVDKYERIFKAHPLEYSQLLRLSDKDLFSIISPPALEKPTHAELLELFPKMEQALTKVGITKLYEWEKYKEKHPSGVQYSQFCEHFRRYLKAKNISYVFEYKAGDKLLVDFAGKKLHLTDPLTGELTEVEFFVGVLPASGYTFAKACYSQQLPEFLGALGDCLSFLGGVPVGIVTDNLKPAVNKASKYDPELNKTMADFAEHYNVCILPTRARAPKDKSPVEGMVKLLYTRVYAPINEKVYHTLPELNKVIKELVDKHNRMLLQGRDYSRRQTFDSVEKQTLKLLPSHPFELRTHQLAKVQPNCHVLLSEDKHNYSVPYQYVGKKVSITYNQREVEIYYNLERIALHERLKFAFKYSTNKAHLHPRHQYYSNWSDDFFKNQGVKIGENTHLLMVELLGQGKHPEQGFKRCQGVLQLARKYGNEKIEEASSVCIHYDMVSYKKLEYILKEGINLEKLENQPTYSTPVHENIRGSAYYQ
jgi:transposase